MGEAKMELALETEFLISDYLPQVFKVVKCLVVPVVLQKQVSMGRVSVEGYLRCIVFYQAEGEGGLCRAEQKIPFSRQCECRQGEYDYANAPIDVGGETEYVNCRAVSGRRIEVRGAFALSVRAYAYQSSDVITALEAPGVYHKSDELSSLCVLGTAEKLITLEQEADLEYEPEMILHTRCSTRINEVRLSAGKAVLKGELRAELLYRAKGRADLLHAVQSIDFQEILDVEQAAEQAQASAFLQVLGCTATMQEHDELVLSMSCVAGVRVWQQVQCRVVSDAFSASHHLELTQKEILCEHAQPPIDEMVQAAVSGQLPDTTVHVLEALATPLGIEAVEDAAGTALRGRVMVHVFCENEMGELECYDKLCEYTLQARSDKPPSQLCVVSRVQICELRVQKSGEELSAELTLHIAGEWSVCEARRVLTDIHPQAERELTGQPSLYLYFAQPGEAVFDIAKRYAAPPNRIAVLNGLEDEVLTQAVCLLIAQGVS